MDADAVLELKNAGAIITFYDIDYKNPKVLVDGKEDSSVVFNVTYNKSTKTLEFNAAHFTTFEVIEAVNTTSSSTSSSTSKPSTPSCGAQKPSNAPNLFQIDTTKDSATLYLTPVNPPIDSYYIVYGYLEGDERFVTSFKLGEYKGVVSYTITHLQPNTVYAFKVRDQNSCMPGDWSNWKTAKTKSQFIAKTDTLIYNKEDKTSEETALDLKESTPTSTLQIKEQSEITNEDKPTTLTSI